MIIIILVTVLIGDIYEDNDSLIVNDDSLTICGNHQYNIKVHITNNGKLYIRQWSGASDSTGWLFMNAPSILIQDSSSINGSGLGYKGGDNVHPDGYGPGCGQAGNTGAGGGAGYGGSGGNGAGIPGAGGVVYGDSSDTLISMGSGGGAGRVGGVEGFGGNGGANVYLRAQKIVIDSSYIQTNGQYGSYAVIVAGGGGSGGGIMIWADSTIIISSAITSDGGAGGDSDGYGGGGAGGGRVKMFYSSFLDTSGVTLSVQGGNGGIGGWENGEPGTSGSIYFGLIVGIIEIVNRQSEELFIQPNPVKNRVKIAVEDPPLFLTLYDISGRAVKSFIIKEKTKLIDLGGLNEGIYFLGSAQGNKPLIKIILLK